ncbi:MAG: DUF2281 domain-containing protein [Bacteroidetes bacterium]|nr:DUF2281 domain-containing protein [Bacteroidota bacterium]
MTEQLILRELHELPEAMKVEVLHFVQFLKTERSKKHQTSGSGKRRAGGLKGKIWIAPDFKAPLEDFKDYM